VLNPVTIDQPEPSSSCVTQAASPQSIIESQPCDVKSSFSGDEFDYQDFKSPHVELTEEDESHIFHQAEQVESEPITSHSPSELVLHQGQDVSMQSFSDADSISEHSIQSDTSYTKVALQ